MYNNELAEILKKHEAEERKKKEDKSKKLYLMVWIIIGIVNIVFDITTFIPGSGFVWFLILLLILA